MRWNRYRNRPSFAIGDSSRIKEIKIGLPEILVGLFPGLGGTTRVARMMGLMGASSVLLEGKLLQVIGRKMLD